MAFPSITDWLQHPAAAAAALAPPAAPAPAPAPAAPPIGSPGQTNLQAATTGAATDLGIQDLNSFGLPPDLSKQAIDWVMQENSKGVPAAQQQLDMYQQPWFKTAFPGIVAQIKNGNTNVISPQQYMTNLQTAREMLASFKVDPGVLSDQLYGGLVGQGLTGTDITNRLGLAFSTANGDLANNHPALGLLNQWYGVPLDPASLAEFYITGQSPKGGKALGTDTLANVTQAALGGGGAASQGFSKLDQNTLMSMAAAGVSGTQITAAATAQEGLLRTTKAQTGQETVTQGELLAAQGLPGLPGETGAQAAERVARAVGGRTGAFHGGGGSELGTPGTPGGGGYGTQ